jgi:hypothetical protein
MARYPEVEEKGMARIATGFAHHKEVSAALRRVKKQFPKDVMSIDYRLGKDWDGDPTMFFDIVLSEEARRPPYTNLGRLGSRISIALDTEVRPDEFGLRSYPHFYSPVEYETRKEEISA